MQGSLQSTVHVACQKNQREYQGKYTPLHQCANFGDSGQCQSSGDKMFWSFSVFIRFLRSLVLMHQQSEVLLCFVLQ